MRRDRNSRILKVCTAAMLVAAGALSSCILDEQVLDAPVPDGEKLTIKIAVPGNSRPSTRALGATGEYAVSEVTVLAFDEDDKQFYGRYPGFVTSGPTGTGGTGSASAEMTFQVTLPVGEFDLMVVANGNTLLNAAATAGNLDKGDAQTTVIEAIQATMNTSGWDVTTPAPLPMWGYKTEVEISETSTSLINPINLTRMVAKVDIQLGSDLIAADKFELQSVRVYNYSEQGRLVPDIAGANAAVWDGITFAELEAITAPTLPSGYTRATSASEWIDYTLAPGETALERSIYLFEVPAGVNPVSNKAGYLTNTCLVIGGDYNEGGTTYYRIDFAQNNAYLPLLRNHSYAVTVTDITGNGHGTQDDALKSVPVNINANILDWEENDTSVEGSDGIYKLKLSQRAFGFPYKAQTTASTDNKLTVTTDHANGWSAKVWDDEAGTAATTASSWLTLSTSSATSATPALGTEISLIATSNTSTTVDRTAWIHISAGVVTLKVEVMQERSLNPGVLAAPGVIGYIKDTNILTIKGSMEYAGTPVMGFNGDPDLALATGEPLEDATVYVAYFKFGSLVATRSEYRTTSFEPEDVVNWPSEWAANRAAMEGIIGTGTPKEQWENIPLVALTAEGQDLMTDGNVSPIQATGDPCIYWADKNGWGDDWKLPSAGTSSPYIWYKDGGSPFGVSLTDNTWPTVGGNGPGAAWIAAGTSGLPVAGAVGGASATPGDHDWSMFLPAGGARYDTNGLVLLHNSEADYWSSTGANNAQGYFLRTSPSPYNYVFANAEYNYSFAFPIRCVQSTPATTLSVTPTERTFDWDALDQSQSQVFTVTANGAWTTVFPASAMNNFEIKQYTANGTLATTVNYDELYAFFGFGNGTIVVTPKNNNTSTTTERTFDFTVEAIGATATAAAPKTITVIQECAPIPGMRNVDGTVDGIIGYIHHPGHPDHHKLTMEKDDGDDSDGIVYVAYFKFGSLVATSSQKPQPFTSSDIIAWPSEWKSTTDDRASLNAEVTGSGKPAWDKVPYVKFSAADITNYGKELMDHPTVADNAAKGDPCQYYSGDLGSGWRLPTAKENVAFVGRQQEPDLSWNNGNTFSFSASAFSGVWTVGTYPFTTTPGMGNFPVEGGGSRTAFSESVPAAGFRNTMGNVMNQGSHGYYWSSTAYNNTYGYDLYFLSSSVTPANNPNYENGLSVRCVQNPPKSDPEPTGSEVLYFDGEDNLQVGTWGSDVTETSKLAFFKFGSVVGLSSTGSWGVVFNPTANTYNTYASVPSYTAADLDLIGDYNENDIPTGIALSHVANPYYHNAANLALGKGDPCVLAGFEIGVDNLGDYDSGWRLPSVLETRRSSEAPNTMPATLSPTNTMARKSHTGRMPAGLWAGDFRSYNPATSTTGCSCQPQDSAIINRALSKEWARMDGIGPETPEAPWRET